MVKGEKIMNQTELLRKLDRINSQLRIVAEYEHNSIINSINDELVTVIQEYEESISESKPKNFNVSTSLYIDADKLHQEIQTELRKMGVKL